MSVSTLEMSHERWLAERRNGIGGSDAAAVVGLDPYRTPLDVYMEKRGEKLADDLSDNDAVRFGLLLEPVLAEEYSRRTGRAVHRVNRILQHPTQTHMRANLDRRVVGERRGLEIKTTSVFAARHEEWGEPGSDVVPTRYLLQVAHYLAVTGYDAFDLAVLIGGNAFRIYEIRRDEQLIANLVRIEQVFWNRVVDGTPPPIVTYAEASRVFPQHVESPIAATPEIAAAHVRYREIKAAQKQLDLEMDGDKKLGTIGLQAQIAAYLGEHDTLLVNDAPVLTWRTQTSSRFDATALQTDHPDLYAAYLRESTSRVMRMKGTHANPRRH